MPQELTFNIFSVELFSYSSWVFFSYFLLLIKKLQILLNLIHFHSRPIKHSLDRKQNMLFDFFLFLFSMNVIWVKAFLGGITRNHPKEWLKNQKRSNHFLGRFIFKKFTTIIVFLFMFINCKH